MPKKLNRKRKNFPQKISRYEKNVLNFCSIEKFIHIFALRKIDNRVSKNTIIGLTIPLPYSVGGGYLLDYQRVREDRGFRGVKPATQSFPPRGSA